MYKLNKVILFGFIFALSVLCLIITVYGLSQEKSITAVYNDIKIFIDNQVISLQDINGKSVEPFIIDGTTYIPLRAISENLDKDVVWDGEQKHIYINEKGKQLDEFRAEWYQSILSMFEQTDIHQKTSNVIQEYRIANSASFSGVRYFDIQIFSDRTGTIALKTYSSEYKEKGKLIYDKTVKLTEKQATEIIKIIEENYFWQIPIQHPDEELGMDGFTLFMEGLYGKEYNICSMWEPTETYSIWKIYSGIDMFSRTLGIDDTNALNEIIRK